MTLVTKPTEGDDRNFVDRYGIPSIVPNQGAEPVHDYFVYTGQMLYGLEDERITSIALVKAILLHDLGSVIVYCDIWYPISRYLSSNVSCTLEYLFDKFKPCS